MNRDEIIELAKEAGFTQGDLADFSDLIVHFAALVAAAVAMKNAGDAERWRIAKKLATVRKTGRKLYKTDEPRPSTRLLKGPDFTVVTPEINDEYEVCLFACIGETSVADLDAIMDAAAVIRARGEK